MKKVVALFIVMSLLLSMSFTAFALQPAHTEFFSDTDKMCAWIENYSKTFPDADYAEIVVPSNGYELKHKDFLVVSFDNDDYTLTDLSCSETGYNQGIDYTFSSYDKNDGYTNIRILTYYQMSQENVAKSLDRLEENPEHGALYTGEILGYRYVVCDVGYDDGSTQCTYKIAVDDVLIVIYSNSAFDKALLDSLVIENSGIKLPVFETLPKVDVSVSDELLEAVKAEFNNETITKEDIHITDLEVVDESKQLVRYTVAGYGNTCEVVEQKIGDYLLYVPQRPLPQILVGSILYDIKEAYENEILTDNDLATISTFKSDAYTFTKTGFTPPIEEPDIEANVFVDVSAVITGDEGFWAWIWDDNTQGHWVPMNTSENETGYFVVTMSVGQNVVFARIRSGEQPDWSLVWNQTEDTKYTGEYNCAVLSYSDTIGGKMPVTWKNINAIDKSAMVKAMREAEKYLYEEPDKYTTDSLNVLWNAYYNAQSCYESATTQEQFDKAMNQLNTAISQLVLKDEPVTIDKTMLRVAIDTATSYYMSLDKFTDESWNTMEEKLENAYEVYENEKATQAEVNLATQELQDAINGLERIDELIGDVDGDGIISILDATAIQKYLAHLIELSDSQLIVADISEDGGVSIIDATAIQLKLAKVE